MILTKTLNIKNIKIYKDLGYISDSEGFTEIKIEDLQKGSHIKVLAKCDFCETQKIVSYRNYNRNIINMNLFSCSKKCAYNKNKVTNLERYGVENPAQNKEIREKNKVTNLEKYGVENPLQNKEIFQKMKQTNLERYGVENVSSNIEIHKKIVNTILEKYGVKNALQNSDLLQKMKQTNLERYGFEHALQNDEILEKMKQTNLEKYGGEWGLQNDHIKNKIKLTNLEKYGVEYSSQNVEVKITTIKNNKEKYGVDFYKKTEESRIGYIITNHPNYIKYIDNRMSLFRCDLNKDHRFEIHSDNFHSRTKQNLPLCTICYPIGNSRSLKEEIIYEYIKSIYSGEIIQSYRDQLEIDIYLPDLRIGIEFNGLYWHSEKFKENNYHINKLNFFKSKDIDIKFIYEDDFDNNLKIIKSQISNWLSLTQTKIYARKCLVKEILNTEEYRNFLDSNHIQGYVPSKLIYGLYYNDQLVSLMCFDKKEGRLNMLENEWNLSRFCNLLNTNVIGGASKLLNYFIKENNPKRVISYADKYWSSGNLYLTLGFKLLSESKPDYKYIVDGLRKSKQNFTKTKLGKMGHDISLTESQIMENIGIDKIYDCGKMKFEKILNKK